MRQCTLNEINNAAKICCSCLLPLVILQRNYLKLYNKYESELSPGIINVSQEIYASLGQDSTAFINSLVNLFINTHKHYNALISFLTEHQPLTSLLNETKNELTELSLTIIKLLTTDKHYKNSIILFLATLGKENIYILKPIYDSAATCYLKNSYKSLENALTQIDLKLLNLIGRYYILNHTNPEGAFIKKIETIKDQKDICQILSKNTEALIGSNSEKLHLQMKAFTVNFQILRTMMTDAETLLKKLEGCANDKGKIHKLLFPNSIFSVTTEAGSNNTSTTLAPGPTSE